MSTKITLKRIALVVVSVLGLGFLSAAPSNAAAGFSSSMSLGWSATTVVVGTQTNVDSVAGLFYVDIANDSTGTLRNGLATDTTESLTVTVSADPDGEGGTRATTDLKLKPVRVDTTVASGALKVLGTQMAGSDADSWLAQELIFTGDTASRFESSNFTRISSGNSAAGSSNRYWFAVAPVAGKLATVTGAGKYTLSIRLDNNDGTTRSATATIRFVSTVNDAGAVITVSATGSQIAGESTTYNANQAWSATLRDADGGRIQIGKGVDTQMYYERIPVLDARIVSSTDAVLEQMDTVTDTGTAGVDHVATTSETTNPAALLAARTALDGVYGITNYTDASNLYGTSTTNKLLVRLLNSDKTGSATITTFAATTLVAANTTVALTGTGVRPADTLATLIDTDESISYNLPLTNKSVTLSIDVGSTVGAAIVSDVDWTANYATADVTPASDTKVTNYTDADGAFTVTLTNANPLAGAQATVTLTGYTGATDNVNTITINWVAAAASSITVVEPVSGAHQVLKGTTTFSLSVRDQFNNPVADAVVQPSLSSTSSNYSATTTYATVKSGATGIATWSLTDAKAVADGTDAVTFTVIGVSGVSTSYTITYKATVATVGSFLTYYQHDFDSTTASDITTAVPTTGIYTSAGAGLPMVIARNLSFDLVSGYDDNSSSVENDAFTIKVRALTSAGIAAAGASVTVTASTGGHIVGVDGLPTSTRTFAVPASGDITFAVLATAPGAIKWTITSGTKSAEVVANIATPTQANARFITITGGTTGSAFGEGVPVSVAVTDRYGNGVSGVTLTLAASGVGSFAGGATTQSFTTDATGKYTFLATSNVAAGGTGTYSATAGNAGDATSLIGYVGATAVDSTLKAGNSTASASVTFAAGVNPTVAAAEAATDAALEAIDAANAATDAANLAAEAADAATVAAEEARDAADSATAAVEALASEVATLIAGLKAQITTLANTVAKIAKKVKA